MPSLRIVPLLLALAWTSAPVAVAQNSDRSDGFDRLMQINEASLVMLREIGLVSPPLSSDIARAMQTIRQEQAQDGAARSEDYLVFEARLNELVGVAGSRIHTGRSRQDIGSTNRRMALRDALLDTYAAMLAPRQALVDLAAKHVDTVVPAYTHGVQAQPTSLAHYLLAFAAAFERDAERLQQAYVRLNRCPLGAAALGTSSFRLDRARLAELLGFDDIVENSYDANLVSSMDSKIEFTSALAISALHVGQFAEDLHTQYHEPDPWLQLDPSQTSPSSIMPQKRNPRPLDRLRTSATDVVAEAQRAQLRAHNTNTGMNDYRDASPAFDAAAEARRMYSRFAEIVRGLVVDPARARAEIDADYSTMTEIADVLMREGDVPFRTGHHYASAITDYGRARGLHPTQLSPEVLEQIYRDTVGQDLPVPVAHVRDAMDPERMVAGRRGTGGPEPAEVQRMLEERRTTLAASRAWLRDTRARLAKAAAVREQAFAALSAAPGRDH